MKHTFYEFFCGAGMVRAGLGKNWDCIFANDFDGKKALTYQNNWGADGELQVKDIREISANDLRGSVDLAWASFPCQDLSLAGNGAGLKGKKSNVFYQFWNIIKDLVQDGRGPKIVAVENVCGTLTSHSGQDFKSIVQCFLQANYRCGAVVIDAELFVPQSRRRLFIIGIRQDVHLDGKLIAPGPISSFHSRSLQKAVNGLDLDCRKKWLWWNLPAPPLRKLVFSDILETNFEVLDWHSPEQTKNLLSIMSPINLAKVDAAARAGRVMVGGVYKRTRPDISGRKVRAEVRFDDIAGCLRTPNGGSSRQTILIVEGLNIHSRLITARETARLMGLSDSYKLPKNYNEAYHLTGDGVVVPVVAFLSKYLFEPILFGKVDQNQDSQLLAFK